MTRTGGGASTDVCPREPDTLATPLKIKLHILGVPMNKLGNWLITPASITHRTVKLRAAWSDSFRLWRIEWCDRHLCNVTDSDHAQLNAGIRGWLALD